ncbi:DUF418 domain-containing protein [Pseudoduganella chitinolytica]|uniref:DUF418 domain-containing protein n=1 Tax=Pseudoduganella chitinolytica TaxID=34070 RepID=A0ABY8BJF8_9BURK|nr:DUF418 domain-containing protein [Pseudoduganella chitinolytica]WEF35538.1 DUF418 domain-containing protein [Pseudoduganella chitinolytica]
MTPSAARLDLVDALRGFAIASIMLLHNIEHFDLTHVPAGQPGWLASLDRQIWDSAFFLFGGKSYAIFALLFGVTFHLQFSARAARGEDFRPRFVWRMALLLAFGLFNSLFYQGDILTLYAVLALALLPVARLRDGLVLATALILLLQPAAWLALLQALPAPAATLPDPASWAYFGRANEYLANGTLAQVWLGNLTNGKEGVLRWSWENGRLFQIPALFMLGMLAARQGRFALSHANRVFWRRALLLAVLAFVPLYLVNDQLGRWIAAEGLRRPVTVMVESWMKLAFMVVLVALFALGFHAARGTRVLRAFAPLGRMSLTSYVVQSLVGTTLYYGFGLGLYRVTGATACLAIGLALALLQGCLCAWWLRRYRQGPLEALWHRATWLGAPAPAVRASRTGI